MEARANAPSPALECVAFLCFSVPFGGLASARTPVHFVHSVVILDHFSCWLVQDLHTRARTPAVAVLTVLTVVTVVTVLTLLSVACE